LSFFVCLSIPGDQAVKPFNQFGGAKRPSQFGAGCFVKFKHITAFVVVFFKEAG
jgi:hypothetical protein